VSGLVSTAGRGLELGALVAIYTQGDIYLSLEASVPRPGSSTDQ
jgi:hypothetical protein